MKIKNFEETILEFLINYEKINKEDSYKINRKQLKSIIKDNSKTFNLNYKFYATMDSIKFNLAIKGSLLTAIAVFIVFYFNIPNGRWILYTITVTYLPFSELGAKKLKDRVYGTIIGFALSIILFTISQNDIFIIICILISLYFSIYYIPYNKRAIFITFTAIASDYFIQPTEGYVIICFYRLAFVAIAAIITYIVLKYIYPINMNKSIDNLRTNYKKLNSKVIEELEEDKNDIENSNYEILIINKMLWRRAVFLKKYKNIDILEKLIEKEEFIFSEYNYLERLSDKEIEIAEKMIIRKRVLKSIKDADMSI